MKRLKLLAAVALLGIPLAACDEVTPPPPVGSIVGQVSIEGTGIDGVSVNLSNGNSTTTSGGGSYRFDNVEGGAYTVTISGFPSDANFDATSAAATISSAGQSVTLNFTGSYIRTASVMGSVTVENMGLGGVTVALSGVSSATTVTDDNGQYTFTGLRMGSYSVDISGFNNDEIGFSATSSAVTVGTGESKIVSFDGTYLRTAGIQGQVSVEGMGLEGVNVSLAGGPDGEDMSTTTDAAGLYSFAKLRAGDYAVGISGFDTDDYEFAVTSQNVTIALGETANVPFDGILRRTSGIAGRVSVGGMGIAEVTVTVSADGMDDRTAMTDATGQYAVSALAAGDYTVTISGYDAVEYMFEDSQNVMGLAMDAVAIVNFAGTALRSGSIAVSVTADDEGVAGAGVTLTMITGATSGTVLGTQATDADGGTTFGPLLAGNYLVAIAVDSDEIDFESTDATVMVATAEAATATFAGTIIRTGSIAGSVTVDGEGMSGWAVMLSGGADAIADSTMMTGDDGSYSFGELRKGDYTVSITNPDVNRYEFTSTSESVSLAVGQSQDANFAGSMVTSSSISGRVGLDDGTGVEGVAVTLSGAAARSDTTDAGGLYTFTGLGAGPYTVSITLSDDQEAAYNFDPDSLSKSRTLGDDDQQTVNFLGSHDASASVTVRLFIDEGGTTPRNDMFDEGEHPFPTPEMLAMVAQAGLPLALPISLDGPGVGETNSGTAMPDGSMVFSGLTMGTYQLSVDDISDEQLAAIGAVAPQLAMALRDYAFGGEPAGYEINLGVGDQDMKHVPIDITHTTVNFTAMLKSGENTGDAIPGATVTLYSDAAAEKAIEGAMKTTDDDGMASIRIAREGTTGNTVHATVSHDDYDGDGMTTVMWDPQKTYTAAANDGDIVNLNVDVTISGATVDRGDYGGGDPLAGWDISVMMPGEDDEMVAVEGDDVPTMLGADGTAEFKTTVESVPMTFTIAVAKDQEGKDDDGNELDGGESYEADAVEYEYKGLSLADNLPQPDPLVVTYTTQTLKVYVHHERDQVRGYTGNVLGGDVRASGMIDVDVKYINDAGRSRSFPASAKIKKTDKGGVVTFTGVPADHDVIAVAEEAAQDPEDEDYQPVMLLDPDELAAYTKADGATGGMFGDNGGFGHTVELCSLPYNIPQDHDECGSFAFVNAYQVSGLVWKVEVTKDTDDDFNELKDPKFVKDIEVSLDTVGGKNLAGKDQSFTTLAKAVKGPGETSKGTEVLDETHQFDFGAIAAGVYKLSATPGWRVRTPAADDDLGEHSPKGSTGMVGNAFNPLAGDIALDVTPATGVLYGRVTDSDGLAAEDVDIDVNGEPAKTDEFGRYIVEGFSKRPKGKHIIVTASGEGFTEKKDSTSAAIATFAANAPQRFDFTVVGAADIATISGTVTKSGTGDGVGGVQITPSSMLLNPNAKSPGAKKDDIYVTAADGSYTVQVEAVAAGENVTVTASKKDMSFSPASHTLSAVADSKVSGIDFTAFDHATITGRVRDGEDGPPVAGVKVTATLVGEAKAAASYTTRSTGTFRLSVAFGSYDIEADHANYSFGYPNGSKRITVAPGTTVAFGDITATESDNHVPTISSDADFEVEEGETKIGTVEADDEDADDDIESFEILTGSDNGADHGDITIDDETGELTFNSAPDFDDPADDDEDNVYEITVQVTSGRGAREKTATQNIKVEVTSVDEWEVTIVLDPDEIDESGANNTSTVTATVSPASPTAFAVNVTVDGSDEDTDDYEISSNKTLFFAADATESTGSVEITAVNNNEHNDDVEVIVGGTVVPSSLENITIPAYDKDEDVGEAQLTIKDDDVAPPQVTLSLRPSRIDEGETTELRVRLDKLYVDDQGAEAEVTVAIAVTADDDNPTALTALTPTTATVTIEAGELMPVDADDNETFVTITAPNNDAADGDWSFEVSGDANVEDVTDADDVTLRVRDNDVAASAPRNFLVTAGDASITAEWNSPSSWGSTHNGATMTRLPTGDYEYRVYETDGDVALQAEEGWQATTSNPETFTTFSTVTVDDSDPQNVTRAVDNTNTLVNTPATQYTVEVRGTNDAGGGAAATATATPEAPSGE